MTKHVSITVTTLSVLGVLLILLAIIQYRWLGQLSEGELAQMRANLKIGAGRFADDFDKDITQLYSAFQSRYPDETVPPKIFLSSCYKQWIANSKNPQLLKNVYYTTYSNRQSLELLQWMSDSDSLKAIPWDTKFQSVKKRFDSRMKIREKDSSKVNRIFIFHGPVLDDFPFLILTLNPVTKFVRLPLRAQISEFVILELDESYLRTQLIPSLLAQHFPPGDNETYHLTIVNPSTKNIFYSNDSETVFEQTESSDIVNPIARIRMQDFFMVTVSERAPSIKLKGVTKVATSIEINDAKSTAIRHEINDWQDTEADSLSYWELRIKHRSGSLEAAVAQIRFKNLAISSGILLVLGASVVVLVISLRREQFLARRRMEFVAGVTHELRTPLTVLKSAGENLADGVVKSEEQITQYGKLVRDQGTFLSEMVEQVLDYAGIESGKKLLKKETIALHELLDDLLNDIELQSSKKNISVTAPPCDGVQIVGDYYALKSALHNVLNNAIKYSLENGSVVINVIENDQSLSILVKDHGMGIDPKELSMVFEPFYRTQNVRDSQIHGNGLGLSIVKKIIEQHGGHVSITSMVDHGTTVTIYLPKEQ
ncbi:HAMP domain-containing histidine kinase [bacterium]|nr:HAMP domain-containing histidine kinase [bacterium]